jgi:hypothetical protein
MSYVADSCLEGVFDLEAYIPILAEKAISGLDTFDERRRESVPPSVVFGTGEASAIRYRGPEGCRVNSAA